MTPRWIVLAVLVIPLAAQEATFRITPVRPVEELRREALAARVPVEPGKFRKSDLVELVKLDGTIRLDVRYAATNNFMGTAMYPAVRAMLQRRAAQALVRVHRQLRRDGYGLLVFDAYRPWYVTKMFWEATPPELRRFVADPARGSRHNRGCAVDLTLFELATGREVAMPSGYDEMTERAFAGYEGGTAEARAYRAILRRAMEAEGFVVNPDEWWHFDYREWREYAILNQDF